MIYREFAKLNIKTSLLGFGCMRFPTKADGTINEVEATEMIDYAIKAGVNYIDTAYPYHNGESEPLLGRALAKYPRSSYYLATKLPLWQVKTKEDVVTIFNDQLKRLNTDYIDFYLLHAMSDERFELVKRLGIIEICERLKKEGKIKYLGFSFHDSYETFEKILTYHNWDFCQIQFNYMDTQIQAGLKGYKLAASLGIPMIVMEPVKGGLLAKLPAEISQVLPKTLSTTDASYALRYVAQFDNVKVILSGMSSLDQVKDNLNTFNNYHPLDKTEQKAIEEVVKQLNLRIKNGCTGCRYCMPCPKGVNIPRIFANWNEFGIYNQKNTYLKRVKQQLTDETFINNCIKCGKCEKACPQHIEIRQNFAQIQAELKKLN